jgi:hypothetical protein
VTAPVPSDFTFKDQRTYVHGSSLVESCWEIAAGCGGPAGWSAPRIDATFARMVYANGQYWIADSQEALPPRHRLSAFFRVFDAARSLWLGFEEAPERTIAQRRPTERRIEGCELSAPFSGRCLIDVGTTTVWLENILEANKRLHLMSVAERGVPAVLNAYMRRVPLPATPAAGVAVLDVENVSRKDSGTQIATLSRLRCAAVSAEAFEIAFLLKFGEAAA